MSPVLNVACPQCPGPNCLGGPNCPGPNWPPPKNGRLGPGQLGPGPNCPGPNCPPLKNGQLGPGQLGPGPNCPGPSCPGPDSPGPNLPRILASNLLRFCSALHKCQKKSEREILMLINRIHPFEPWGGVISCIQGLTHLRGGSSGIGLDHFHQDWRQTKGFTTFGCLEPPKQAHTHF